MRITGIELNNWMIHRHLALEIKPLTIIAGPAWPRRASGLL
jgi:hypothetical protein